MTKYRIVAARPKNAIHHLKSEFKLHQYDEEKKTWPFTGWKSIGAVSELLQAGHEVRRGKIADGKMSSGAAVELELRIATNETKYKISEMPDA